MADDSTYISDLNPITELQPNYSFVVETDQGTDRILWQDIIVGPENVSFYNEITENTTNIYALSTDVVTLSASLSALTTTVNTLTSNNVSQTQYGFCYCYLDENGSLFVPQSSTNITDVSIEGGNKLVFTTSGNINFANAVINVTLDSSISAQDPEDVNSNYLTFTPTIINETGFERDVDTFTVSVDILNHVLQTYTLPTNLSVSTNSYQYLSDLTQTTSTLTVGETLTTTNYSIPPSVVQSVTLNTQNRNVVTNVAKTQQTMDVVTGVTSSPITATLSIITRLGPTILRNLGFNISFRY